MKILFITEPLPYPLTSGPAIRIYNILERLSRNNEVWLATLLMSPEELRYVPVLEKFCAGVITGYRELQTPLEHLPGLISYAFRGKPLELRFQFSHELCRKVSDLVSHLDFDIIQVEHSYMAEYLDCLHSNNRYKSILVFRNVTFSQFERIARFETKPALKLRRFLYSIMMRHWEPEIANKFDRCVALSEADKSLLMDANPKLRINIIPNGVDCREKPLDLPVGDPALLYIGNMDYSPNADAVVYFCREILPHIKNKINNIKLWIVGNDPLPEVRSLEGEDIHVVGRVESVRPYYERSNVCIVPLRAGSGTRLKILESMAIGRPVVSTSIGCEGLDVVDGKHLLVADDPALFAEKTVCLLTDIALYRTIKDQARNLVMEKYDWDIIAKALLELYTELIDGPGKTT